MHHFRLAGQGITLWWQFLSISMGQERDCSIPRSVISICARSASPPSGINAAYIYLSASVFPSRLIVLLNLHRSYTLCLMLSRLAKKMDPILAISPIASSIARLSPRRLRQSAFSSSCKSTHGDPVHRGLPQVERRGEDLLQGVI